MCSKSRKSEIRFCSGEVFVNVLSVFRVAWEILRESSNPKNLSSAEQDSHIETSLRSDYCTVFLSLSLLVLSLSL